MIISLCEVNLLTLQFNYKQAFVKTRIPPIRMDKYTFNTVKVFDKFIEKFAQRYVEQRSSIVPALVEKLKNSDCGFNVDSLMALIKSNSTFVDPIREIGEVPSIINDIYRSDLGEILTTYYFEEKLPEGERFIIPLKNISMRERFDMPGRGIDAIGYRLEEDGKIELLLSEAKVSEQRTSPPAVVDIAKDSIYKSQKLHHDNQPLVLQRLTEYVRHLSTSEDFMALGMLIVAMSTNRTDKYSITYGCGLVRDYTCADPNKDFGKMKSQVEDFRPGTVNFAIFSFTEQTISETVDLFYKKVKELTK